MFPLFNIGDIVKINWNEFSKDFGTTPEKLQNTYFNTKEAREFSIDGTFTIKRLLVSRSYENGEPYQIYLLSPNCDLEPTKFMSRVTILDMIETNDLSKANELGYIVFGHESLVLADV